MQPRPHTDYDRMDRVVASVAGLMHFSQVTTALRAQIEGWVTRVIQHISQRGRWWWLENEASAEIPEGADVVDLCGDIALVREIYCPQRLRPVKLSQILQWRAEAAVGATDNGGDPQCFALESGFRVHLWPCPASPLIMSVLYDRPPDIALLPVDWDGLLVDGAIALWGKHYDRSGILGGTQAFVERFERELRFARARHRPGIQQSSPLLTRAQDAPELAFEAYSTVPRHHTFVMPDSLAGDPGLTSIPLPEIQCVPISCERAPLYYSDGWGYDGTVEYLELLAGCEGVGYPGEGCEALEYSNAWGYDGTVEYIACGDYEAPPGYVSPTPTPEVPLEVLVPDYQRDPWVSTIWSNGEVIPFPIGSLIDPTKPWSLSVDTYWPDSDLSTPALIWGADDGPVFSTTWAKPTADVDFITPAEGGIASAFAFDDILPCFPKAKIITMQSSGPAVMRRIDEPTLKEDLQYAYTLDSLGNPIVSGNLDVVTPEGFICFSSGGSNTRPIIVASVDTLAPTATFGVSSASLTNSSAGFVSPGSGKSCWMGVGGTSGTSWYAIIGSVFDNVGLLEVTGGTAAYVWDSDSAPNQPTPSIGSNARIIGTSPGLIGDGFGEGYIMAGNGYSSASADNVNFYRLTVQEGASYVGGVWNGVVCELVASLSPSDVLPWRSGGSATLTNVKGPIYDAADNTIMFQVEGAALDYYMLKMSPDTGAILWRTSIPYFRNEKCGWNHSRIESGIYAQFQGTGAFSLCTWTGELLDPQPGSGWPDDHLTAGASWWDSVTNTYTGYSSDGISQWYLFRDSAGDTVLPTSCHTERFSMCFGSSGDMGQYPNLPTLGCPTFGQVAVPTDDLGGVGTGSVVNGDFAQERWIRFALAVDPTTGEAVWSIFNPGTNATYTVPLSSSPEELARFNVPDTWYLGGNAITGGNRSPFQPKDVRLVSDGELIAYWPLDEHLDSGSVQAGQVLSDRSGNNNHTAIQAVGALDFGDTEERPQREPYELWFDGQSTRIDIPIADIVYDAQEFAVLFTFIPLALEEGPAGARVQVDSRRRFVFWQTPGTTTADPGHMRLFMGDALTGTDLTSEIGANVVSEEFTAGEWVSVPQVQYFRLNADTVLDTGTLYYFQNIKLGVTQDEDSVGYTRSGVSTGSTSDFWTAFHAGREPVLSIGWGADGPLQGVIRDLTFYRLNPADKTVRAWLAAYYPLDDRVTEPGARITDRSGNGHHGTLVALGNGFWRTSTQ